MTILNKLDGRLFRKVPAEHKHMTVYGHQQLSKFTCVICEKEGYLSEAYLESKSKRKHDSDVRPYHASCYNERFRSVKKPKKYKELTADLMQFIME